MTPGFDPWVGKIPWEKKKAILVWRIQWTIFSSWVTKSWTPLSNFLFHILEHASVCFSFAIELHHIIGYTRLPRWLTGKESACQCRRHKRCRFNPWVEKMPWRRHQFSFLEKSHGLRILAGCSPWGRKRVEMYPS